MRTFFNHLTIVALLSALIPALASAADYYVSPSGSDSNPGTFSAPFKSIPKAYSLATAGTTIYVRGGVYMVSGSISLNKSGTSSNPIRVFAYGSEVPILDGTNFSREWSGLISVTGNYNHLKGLEVRNAPEYGVLIQGTGANNTLERLNVHHSGRIGTDGKGIGLYGSAANNLVLNCDSHHNRSNPVGNADGFAHGSTGSGNVFRGNRAWRNSDDGYDLWNGAGMLLEGNYAWENGFDDNLNRLGDGNGFKLGGQHPGKSSGGHTLRNNVAFRNPLHGFDENGAQRALRLYNNTAFNNGPTMVKGTSWGENFYLFHSDNVVKNNLSYLGNSHGSGDASHNSWQLPVTVNANDFASLDYSTLIGPRQSDGSVPASDFLKLALGSDLIDRGLNVGLPFNGANPDLGSYEFGSGSAPSNPNLVLNPGFESGAANWTDWGNTALVTSVKNSGSYSLQAGTGEGGRVQVLSGLTGGVTYVVKAVVRRSQTSSEWCGVSLEFKNASNQVLASNFASITSTTFTTVSFEIAAPSSFSAARLYVWKDAGPALCSVDDFSVTRR